MVLPAFKMALMVRSLLFNANRLSTTVLGVFPSRSISTNAVFPTFFRASLPLLAEPLKKKKKLDPAIVKAREERKKRRIEKNIRRLEKVNKQLKPLEELSIPQNLVKEKLLRNRNDSLTQEELDQHKSILKEWTAYKYKQSLIETKMIDRITVSQQKALDQLRSISEDLYIEAIQMDPSLLPFTASGTTATPPIANYDTPDGDYVDVSLKWL